jgi:hypothetical protein
VYPRATFTACRAAFASRRATLRAAQRFFAASERGRPKRRPFFAPFAAFAFAIFHLQKEVTGIIDLIPSSQRGHLPSEREQCSSPSSLVSSFLGSLTRLLRSEAAGNHPALIVTALVYFNVPVGSADAHKIFVRITSD